MVVLITMLSHVASAVLDEQVVAHGVAWRRAIAVVAGSWLAVTLLY